MLDEVKYWHEGKLVDLTPIRPKAYFYKGQTVVTEKETYVILGSVNVRKVHKRKNPVRDTIDYPFYGVLIESTNTITVASRNAILAGTVTNRYKLSASKVGFLGEGLYTWSLHKHLHCLWTNILSRCYNPTEWATHPTYKDCIVDPRWHNFQNFCEDIQSLENYDTWLLEGTGAYHLDKDKKQEDTKYKIYSKDTCWFCPASINMATNKGKKK